MDSDESMSWTSDSDTETGLTMVSDDVISDVTLPLVTQSVAKDVESLPNSFTSDEAEDQLRDHEGSIIAVGSDDYESETGFTMSDDVKLRTTLPLGSQSIAQDDEHLSNLLASIKSGDDQQREQASSSSRDNGGPLALWRAS